MEMLTKKTRDSEVVAAWNGEEKGQVNFDETAMGADRVLNGSLRSYCKNVPVSYGYRVHPCSLEEQAPMKRVGVNGMRHLQTGSTRCGERMCRYVVRLWWVGHLSAE